jgi:hypothetical protein
MMASSGFGGRARGSEDDLTIVAIRTPRKPYAPAREVAEYPAMIP